MEGSQRGSRFIDSAMVFYENYKQYVPTLHNLSLYVTSSVKDVELRCAIVDPGSIIKYISDCLIPHLKQKIIATVAVELFLFICIFILSLVYDVIIFFLYI